MRKAIFSRFLIISIISLFVGSIFFAYFVGEYNFSQTEKNMEYSINLIDYAIDYNKNLQEQIKNIEPIVSEKNTRITIIDKKGNVFADTSNEIDFFSDHSERPEIINALENGKGSNVRYSESLKRELLYFAKYSQKGDCIIRLAIPYYGKIMFFNTLIPAIIISAIIAFIIAFILSKKFASDITEPLDNISKELLKVQNFDEDLDLKKCKYEETNHIVDAIKILTEKIEHSVQNLKYEKNKINYILDNMKEGIIVIDENKNILLVNKAATKYLKGNIGVENKNVIHFTQNLDIIDAIDDCFNNNKESVFDIKDFDENVLSVHITKIKKGVFENASEGVIVFMIDVTTERETQSLRQEFFSNVSHELKTPITSIQGYAELLNCGIEYEPQQKKEFLDRIQKETKNMTNLINDILMISKLEAGTEIKDFSIIDLKLIVEEILSTNKPIIEKNKINIIAEYEKTLYKSNYGQMYQLLSNLIINAIKYNKEEGNVNIKIFEENKNLNIIIRDTGIGIPSDSVNRVFERFYRVDKGRSKKIGGTGLGLSIVKHIVNFYSGNINMTSKIGVGTKVEIKLPIN